MYWTLQQDGLLFQSEPLRAQADSQLVALPLIQLPCANLAYENLADMQLNLFGLALGEGVHSLSLDAVFLLGLDGFRHYQALQGGSLSYGKTLLDFSDQSAPFLLISQNQKIQRNFEAVGGGIWVSPFQSQSLQVVMSQESDMPLTGCLRVEIRYRPRVRVLP
jgi:hypothetical protein